MTRIDDRKMFSWNWDRNITPLDEKRFEIARIGNKYCVAYQACEFDHKINDKKLCFVVGL